VHFLDFYLDCFPENLEVVSYEKGERYRLDIPPLKSGTKESGAPACWLSTDGHLDEKFRR